MNIDMVNPIPPRNPAPRIFFQVNSAGNEHNPRILPKKHIETMPKGFPINNPQSIPIPLEDAIELNTLLSIANAVLANANNGRIKKATGLCKKSCNR